ncbi:MAG: cobaltochelatase subunit CobN [Deltaproteobacteria bacterium]|nr:cobaltochelatase subunit CobN [Deltaproteobacteria bacterium]
MAAEKRLSLLIIDGDSYLVHQALKTLELPEGFEARAFTLKELGQNPGAAPFVEKSGVLVVDVMGSELAQYVIDESLLNGRRVLALRGSRDDQGLAEKGFIFDERVAEYFQHLSTDNIRGMIKAALGLPTEAVVKLPENGIYHPGAPGVFNGYDEYLQWYEAFEGFDPGRPWLGLMFFSTALIEGQKEAYQDLVGRLERGGFNVLPAFGRDQAVLEKFMLDESRQSRVDLVLAFTLKFYSALNSEVERALADLNVPIFNAINLYTQTIEEWRADPRGIPPLDVIWTLATPEISGLIEPTPLMGKVEEGDPVSGALVYRYQLMPEMTERLLPRLRNWVRLKNKDNADKKVAVIYYNNSRGKQNIGASYLNVFRSLAEILAALKKEGYKVPGRFDLTEEEIKELVLKSGRNIGSWAPGELEALMASGRVTELPIDEYKRWFVELPEEFRQKVLAEWGPPEKSDIMIRNGKIIIPMVLLDNLVIMPEPAVAFTDDPLKLRHGTELHPHHQYLAAYLWLKHGFGADAMVHLGTHATYEWSPGKQAGLSQACPPEVLVTDIPNLYPYIVDNVGEGLQAKRRGRGVVISHLIPPLATAEGYHEYLELEELIASYRQAASLDSPTAGGYFAEIRDKALALGLDKDLGLLDIAGPGEVDEIAVYLEFMETSTIPYGLHTFGKSPADEALEDTARAMLEQHQGLDKAKVRADLLASGPREMAHLIKGLSGGYIPPAEGNDPVRNPAAVPTGNNFYGLSPGRLPTPEAWVLGQKAAEEIIRKHREENNGAWPEKVAVILWAIESLRNEGLNEATVLALIGAEPVWNPSGHVLRTQAIPGPRLGRPRIDVAINASGLYRDLFPDKILFLDEAIRQAAARDDIENFIRQGDERIKRILLESGLSEEEAGRFSKARIFSEVPGSYGNRVAELVAASGHWADDKEIAETYRTHTGYAFGKDFWGAPAKEALDANLKDVQTAWHSASSNLYGLMDNDDMFAFLGGLSAAVRQLSGRAPRALIADQRRLGQVSLEPLRKFIAQEMRSRYLNPKWIEGMKAENYAGAHEMSNYVEYLWGWQVTTPDEVDQSAWEQTYQVYIDDKYNLRLKEFMAEQNPWAYQSITARMLETARKGYWRASDEARQTLAVEYALSVLAKGLACCDHTCNNPLFHQVVMNIISLPGVMSLELAAEFKLAVEKAMQKSLEDQVAERDNLIRDLGRDQGRPERGSGDDLENIRGLKMEPVEKEADRAEMSSSGVEWLASGLVLALVALFFIGFKRRTR